ncbi:MAG: permease [Candidatus Aenigmatarchaeota archaeon]|nr:MAG: permease [Candidatus Aenigmarchaeota archaeon]
MKSAKHRHEITCAKCEHEKKPWYKERLFIIVAILAAAMIVSYALPIFNPFFYAVADYFLLIWWAILIGFLTGGLIDYYVPRSYISKYLSQHKKRTIFYSVFLGFFASACSHGILALAMELYKKGASTPSVIAFLLASPWANLPITILLLGFFGPTAFLFIVSAIIFAVITGFVYVFLDRKHWVECMARGAEIPDISVREDVKKRFRGYEFTGTNLKKDFVGVMKGSWSLTKMVLWWLLIGIMAAGVARAFIPHDWFLLYAGPTLTGMLVVLIFATIIEVCSEGSSPLAFEIYRQTGSFGNPFVFLMAGVSTYYTEIGLISSNIGKRAAIWLPIITVPQILFLGYLFNIIL